MTYSELYHSSIEISNYFTANYKNASKIALLLPNSIDMIKIINALTISPLEIILINFHLTNQEIINQTKVNEMLETFNSMMDCLIDAFENEDPKIARKVFKKDKVLNKINTEAHKIIVDNMNTYDNGMLLFLLSSIRKIERAGDSLKKIGEEIIYHLEAKVLKHQKNKLD